ncbi:DUF1330 domain-containing protein [Jannaschia aquimarina]|uniref:DUF1330 domain-containing protein n=1 Tax=Jannaschia aquimarina TaxID=935700 RepID=A0A0D1DAH5_9RHOB|nr:DUF1330 domain-containing protein [Jannaschia aquimarina]KIT16928.1 hypothetical protein jaqu_14270 [Jannaschia aquimarina]SNT11412.1 Uncharacterized conserved protein, DUF1330 family [Jannaschia aquimarina]
MPKAYWIAHVTVTDPDPYALYAKGATEAFAAFGAKVLARGGEVVGLEGETRPRNVIIEFPDMATARACYESDAYQAARKHRIGAGEAQIMLLEGAE